MSARIHANNKWFAENALDPEFIKAHEHLEAHGNRHVPISHAMVLERFYDKCKTMDLNVFNEQAALSKCGEKYMYVAEVCPTVSDVDYSIFVGFRSFNDESAVFQLSCGTVIDLSYYMQTSAIIPSRKKHTKSILDLLDAKIEVGLNRFKHDSAITEENIALLKKTSYSDELLGKLLLSLGRTKKIGNTNIMKIIDEVDAPSSDAAKNDNSAWRIMSACAAITAKRISNPLQAMDMTKLMHDELMKIVNPGFVPLGDNNDAFYADAA